MWANAADIVFLRWRDNVLWHSRKLSRRQHLILESSPEPAMKTKREQDVRDVTGFERERALICLHRLPAPTFGKGRAFIASPGDAPARCGTISGHPAGTACWAAVNFARSGMIRWLLNTKTGGQTPSQRHDVYRRFIKPVSRRMFISSAALCC